MKPLKTTLETFDNINLSWGIYLNIYLIRYILIIKALIKITITSGCVMNVLIVTNVRENKQVKEYNKKVFKLRRYCNEIIFYSIS